MTDFMTKMICHDKLMTCHILSLTVMKYHDQVIIVMTLSWLVTTLL